MKNILPTSLSFGVNSNGLALRSKATKGFTLIELLVVVSIIAILTIIAISTYAGLQKKGRDSVRRAEIDSLAKSIEARKDSSTGNYAYGADATNPSIDAYDQDYPVQNKKPKDPKGVAKYCFTTSPNASITSLPDATSWISGCPTGPGTWTEVPSPSTNGSTIIAPSNVSPVKHWMLCARLEASEEVFCKADLSN